MKRRTFIKRIVLASGSLILSSQNLTAFQEDENAINMLMIYNNIGNSDRFVSEWGLSLWIENKDTAILFDTGGDPSILWNNLKNSGATIDKLSKIVISHNHSDHVNGLPIILEKIDHKPEVFVPEHEIESIRANNPKARLVGVTDAIQINEYLWSTGQLKDSSWFWKIYEQSIIVVQSDSVFILTGCAHPGIVNIVEKTKEIHPDKKLNLLIGGFHLLNHSTQQIKEISVKLKNLQVDKLAPSHCTGEEAMNIFKNEWKENYIDFKLGNSIRV